MAPAYAAAYPLPAPVAAGPGLHLVGSASSSPGSATGHVWSVAADVLALAGVVLAVPFLILAVGIAVALVVNILLRLLQVL